MPRWVPRSSRRCFWLAVRSGRSVEGAASDAGVSLTRAKLWFRQAGGMSPLSLAPPSVRRLSHADREAIFAGLVAGYSYAAIGRLTGRSTSTVTRELDHNRLNPARPRAVPVGQRAGTRGRVPARPNYSPGIAQLRSEARLARPKPTKLAIDPRLREEVQARLKLNHSPEQISNRLVQDFPTFRRCGCRTRRSTGRCMCRVVAS